MDTAYTVMITRAHAVLEISYFDMDCENQRKSGIFLPAPLEAVSPGKSTPGKVNWYKLKYCHIISVLI